MCASDPAQPSRSSPSDKLFLEDRSQLIKRGLGPILIALAREESGDSLLDCDLPRLGGDTFVLALSPAWYSDSSRRLNSSAFSQLRVLALRRIIGTIGAEGAIDPLGTATTLVIDVA